MKSPELWLSYQIFLRQLEELEKVIHIEIIQSQLIFASIRSIEMNNTLRILVIFVRKDTKDLGVILIWFELNT